MSVREHFEHQIAARRLERDLAQEQLLARFVALEERVAAHRSARRSQPLGWLFGNSDHQPVKGLYVHGDVGRGKTMMMDLFFEASPVIRKRRAHFHEFMADVHDRARVYRQKLKAGAHVLEGTLEGGQRQRRKLNLGAGEEKRIILSW